MKRGMLLLFASTTFLASILLFTAEPMIGKMVLPLFGGTPAVWNTCLVYFQLVLLGAYAFSGGMGLDEGEARRTLSMMFLVPAGLILVLGCTMPPIAPDPTAGGASNNPAARLFWTLVTSSIIPLLVVATTAPLIQRWFTATDHPRAHDPYFLYAASNAGSLLGLLAYPFVIEPNLGLEAQARLWKKGFIVLAISLVSCVLVARGIRRRALGRNGNADHVTYTASPGRLPLRTALGWLVLVFAASSWLMGVTTYLTTDLAAIPLLWVIPLGLYLLSFIVAFAGPSSRAVRLAGDSLPICVLPLVLVMSAGFVHAFWIPLHLLTFLAGAVACHGALARGRPPARHLSAFYVTIALGGLLGGVFNAILAPLLFNRLVEYPMAIVLGYLAASVRDSGRILPARGERVGDLLLPGVVLGLTALIVTNQVGLAHSVPGVLGVMTASGLGFFALVKARRRPLRFALVAAAVLSAAGLTQGMSGSLLHIERDFFGVLRVTEDPDRTVHRLFHGSTLHGQQSLESASAREPLTFFTRSGPIGQLFAAIGPRLQEPRTRVAIVGLGVGTLAAYAGVSQRWTFYEIDPAVERIARDERYFTYLRDCRAESLEVVLGDARLRLEESPDHAYRLIVLDAFSSDSLPVHLVTREAIQLYRSRLAEGGILAFNLSNRYLDLDPLIGRQARDAGLACRIAYDLKISKEEERAGKQPSIWAVMASSAGDLGSLASDPRWQEPRTRPDSRAWTDDYSDLVSYLRPIRFRPVSR